MKKFVIHLSTPEQQEALQKALSLKETFATTKAFIFSK